MKEIFAVDFIINNEGLIFEDINKFIEVCNQKGFYVYDQDKLDDIELRNLTVFNVDENKWYFHAVNEEIATKDESITLIQSLAQDLNNIGFPVACIEKATGSIGVKFD